MEAHTLQLSGVQVEFPFKPYPCQLSYMERVIQALQKASRWPCNTMLNLQNIFFLRTLMLVWSLLLALGRLCACCVLLWGGGRPWWAS